MAAASNVAYFLVLNVLLLSIVFLASAKTNPIVPVEGQHQAIKRDVADGAALMYNPYPGYQAGPAKACGGACNIYAPNCTGDCRCVTAFGSPAGNCA